MSEQYICARAVPSTGTVFVLALKSWNMYYFGIILLKVRVHFFAKVATSWPEFGIQAPCFLRLLIYHVLQRLITSNHIKLILPCLLWETHQQTGMLTKHANIACLFAPLQYCPRKWCSLMIGPEITLTMSTQANKHREREAVSAAEA